MKFLFFVLSQLVLVTLVYAFAYRAGYRSAQSRAMSVVRKFADPVTCLLDQLNESMEKANEDEPEEEEANRKEVSNLYPKSKGPKTNIEHPTSNIEG